MPIVEKFLEILVHG
nr:unnamed protein product [Callosobruchus analis]